MRVLVCATQVVSLLMQRVLLIQLARQHRRVHGGQWERQLADLHVVTYLNRQPYFSEFLKGQQYASVTYFCFQPPLVER